MSFVLQRDSMVDCDLDTLVNEINLSIEKIPIQVSLNYYENKVSLKFETALTDTEKNSVITICNNHGIPNDNIVIE
jgi:hypothetical protein